MGDVWGRFLVPPIYPVFIDIDLVSDEEAVVRGEC